MASRYFVTVLVTGLAVGMVGQATAEPQSPLVPGGAYFRRHPAYEYGSPGYQVPYQQGQQMAEVGQYPWYGTAWGVPTYNWGYFGAEPYPTIKWHKAYYRDFLQWGQWRRY